jgi:hypothetical protein
LQLGLTQAGHLLRRDGRQFADCQNGAFAANTPPTARAILVQACVGKHVGEQHLLAVSVFLSV